MIVASRQLAGRTSRFASTGRLARLAMLWALPLASGCDQCGPAAPTSDLRFFQDGQLIVDDTTVNYRTFSSSQLGSLPTVPLSALSVDISGQYSLAPVAGLPGQQIEAHLFVGDLSSTVDQLRFLPAAGPVVNWDTLVSASHLGGTAVLPFPPNADWNTSVSYNPGPLLSTYFWPNDFPGAPASDPRGGSSIKSVRLYKSGLCGYDVDFTTPKKDGIFDTVSDKLFDGFRTEVLAPSSVGPVCSSSRGRRCSATLA